MDRVSIKLKPGVYGLLGANGAGKTTLMRMICGIQNPTSGQIKYNGTDIKKLGRITDKFLVIYHKILDTIQILQLMIF